eukprot:4744140-Prymnesium_polylepis.1
MHGADVCLFTHLFLTKHGFDKRLSKVQLLGALLGAIVHDFNHPGTTNAHEVKLGSSLAVSWVVSNQSPIVMPVHLTYSDQSVLEFHHMWAAFCVLKTPGFDILSGLSTEEYRAVRALMIQLILNTDLSKHFDHIGKLKTLAAVQGHKKMKDVHDASKPASAMHASEGTPPPQACAACHPTVSVLRGFSPFLAASMATVRR